MPYRFMNILLQYYIVLYYSNNNTTEYTIFYNNIKT